ncbi:MAG TPA: hypothetical protein VFQ53_08940 [Kofleriaceae bacterium]|nr:hypothetical protein [Kofleriaceae bacterium]
MFARAAVFRAGVVDRRKLVVMQRGWLGALLIVGACGPDRVDDFIGRWAFSRDATTRTANCTNGMEDRTRAIGGVELEIEYGMDADLVVHGGWYDETCMVRFDVDGSSADVLVGEQCSWTIDTRSATTTGTLTYVRFQLDLTDTQLLSLHGGGTSTVEATEGGGQGSDRASVPTVQCDESLRGSATWVSYF